MRFKLEFEGNNTPFDQAKKQMLVRIQIKKGHVPSRGSDVSHPRLTQFSVTPSSPTANIEQIQIVARSG